MPYFLSRYDPDPLRYYLTALRPRRRHRAWPEGTEESPWEEFVERNNNEWVATHSLRSAQAWAKSELPAGQALRAPAPLFKKLDESVIEEEYVRLEAVSWDSGAGVRDPALFDRQKTDFQILLDAVWTTPAGSDHRFSRTPPSLNV